MIQIIVEVVMGAFIIFLGIRILGLILNTIKINDVKK